jgi:oligopeptide transport system substrate-binding protein
MIETAQLKNYEDVMAGELALSELGVKALDDYTLEVRLEAPVAYFNKLITFPNFYPVNEKFVKEVGDQFGTSITTALFNGPFRLSQWQEKVGYGYVKNEAYWDKEEVLIDAVYYTYTKEVETPIQLYEDGKVDKIRVSGELFKAYENHPDLQRQLDSIVYYLKLHQKAYEK